MPASCKTIRDRPLFFGDANDGDAEPTEVTWFQPVRCDPAEDEMPYHRDPVFSGSLEPDASVSVREAIVATIAAVLSPCLALAVAFLIVAMAAF